MKRILSLCICTLSCLGVLCQPNKDSSHTKPLVIGEVHEIISTVLAEKRILNIYLPEGYHSTDTMKYPVVYLLDGGLDEDFIHVVGVYQFNSFPWINRVAPSIIVGIANVDRRRDMTYPTTDTGALRRYPEAGHSDRFMNFIEQELQPYIERKFKVNSSRTLIGESLGGLLATEILLKKPTMFNKYIIVSPSLWWDNGSLLKRSSVMLSDTFSQRTRVYLSVGKEGVTPGTIPHVQALDANLLADKLKGSKSKTVTVYFDYLPQEDHPTIMHQSLYNALVWGM